MENLPLHLLSTDGFIKAFEEKTKELPTKQAAFEATNQEHEKHFKKLKYSNYDSFRNVRNKKLKSVKN